MLNTLWITLPISVVLGFLSGLGTGGGSLLILWLTFALDVPQAEARVMNLMFFIPSAVIACLFRWKEGRLRYQQVLPGILAGCLAAACCSLLTAGQSPLFLKKAFGALLIYTGIREILYRKK